ncbi:hypothetical protein CYY_000206 [Polysphondylium violaceum]|uniref:FNIP repeat-containing protein n=1 Tax=Polysphondylium violaceum TaxID=133409 RepID=A0A8J4Q266_9MYCE|nr:hypothetical protein CYY_000206 [Polysphondylium violaceum]
MHNKHNCSNNNNRYFYSLWRNRYIRDCIRNNVCSDTFIDATIEYLNNNHRFLSLFSYNEKVEYNIIIHVKIKNRDDVIEYVNNKHRDLIDRISIVNGVDVTIDNDQQQQQQQQQPSRVIRYDCDLFHQGLQSLSFPNQKHMVGSGKLPDSIRKLTISEAVDKNINNPLVDMILAELPSQLERLSLPRGLNINVPTCKLPNTLKDFRFRGTYENLKPFVVPPNKVFDCTIDVKSDQDLQWLTQHTWVNQAIFKTEFDATRVLPSHLTSIKIDFLDGRLEKGILPSSLTSLYIFDYDEPLEVGVLPPGLLELDLPDYDHPLEQGHLPDSLTELDLGSYNQPLEPFVLPNNLTRLTMYSFNQECFQANTLPHSLSYLQLWSFKGSFEHVGSLDNPLYNCYMPQLIVDTLHESVATLLQNVTTIKITTNQIGNNVYLKDTAIQDLVIVYRSDRYNLYPGFLPSTLQKLDIIGLDIKMDNLIPQSCIYLKTDIVDLNSKLIPLSVQITKYE